MKPRLEGKPAGCVITPGVRESHIFTCSDSRRILPPRTTRFHLWRDFTLGLSYSSPSAISDSSERRKRPREEGRAVRDDLSRSFICFPTPDRNHSSAKGKRKDSERKRGSNIVKKNDKCIFHLSFITVGLKLVLKLWKICLENSGKI